jgi:hypothetical protein
MEFTVDAMRLYTRSV